MRFSLVEFPRYTAAPSGMHYVKGQSMGVDCRVEDEEGGVLSELLDARSLVFVLLGGQQGVGANAVSLRFIDEYGDTTFNQLQIPVLLQELREAIFHCENPEARVHGEKLVSLIASAEGEVHTYVKFIGD